MRQYPRQNSQQRYIQLQQMQQLLNGQQFDEKTKRMLREADGYLMDLIETDPQLAGTMIQNKLQRLQPQFYREYEEQKIGIERQKQSMLPIPLPFNWLVGLGLCLTVAVIVLVLPLLFHSGFFVDQFMITLIGLPVIGLLLWLMGIIDFDISDPSDF